MGRMFDRKSTFFRQKPMESSFIKQENSNRRRLTCRRHSIRKLYVMVVMKTFGQPILPILLLKYVE